MVRGIIDRFEDDIVVIEIDGVTKDYPKAMLPKDAQVGDVVQLEGDTTVILKDETDKRRKEIEQLMDDVWED